MELEKRVAKAAIMDREWVQIEIDLNKDAVVEAISFKAIGCHKLIQAAQHFVEKSKNSKLETLAWDGLEHWDLLIQEAILRLKGVFKLPLEDEELCHCRRIPTAKVDNAIVLGAHTPEKVRAWTSASSGCGTCRPNVEKIISYRTGKVS